MLLFVLLPIKSKSWINNFIRGKHMPFDRQTAIHLTPDSQPNDSTPFLEESPSSVPKQRQLWLDLRGTAIRPNEALMFLKELSLDDEETTDSNLRTIDELVDRILVSEQAFEQMVHAQISGNLVYVTDDGKLVEDSGQSQQSILRGKVLLPSKEGHFDLTSIFLGDEVNDWVLVDCNNDDIDKVQMLSDHVEGIVQILLGSSLGDSPPLEKCVAITCPTRNLLLSMDRFLVSQSLHGSITSQTESGLCISSNSFENNQVNGSSSMMATAIVLPFDLKLWKTASELQQL